MTADDDSMNKREHHFEGPGALDRALTLVRFLRENCPWDAAQTAESLVPHLLEETHEVVDAIRNGEAEALEGELGDLLLNLAFQIVVAEEQGDLDADSVYSRLEAKMMARHPQLFGTGEARNWEVMKAQERSADQTILSGLATGLDPLTKAHRIQERVASVGFDWDHYEGALEKVVEEVEEVREALDLSEAEQVTEELGDLLFSVVNLTRLSGSHATTALARANEKFRARFERLETLATDRGVQLETAGLEALDRLWDEIKASDRT